MSIINRLKKLQSQIIGNDSDFCNCEKEIRNVVIYPGANGEPIREPPEDYITPEFCATCGKPNAEPLHVTINPNENLTKTCEHPPSMFHLRRDYPAKGYPDRRLIIKGHCDVCGFDDNLWAFYNLTEEQEARRQELQRASDFWASDAYELELVNAGLIRYAVYPPSPEVQIKFTGKVSV